MANNRRFDDKLTTQARAVSTVFHTLVAEKILSTVTADGHNGQFGKSPSAYLDSFTEPLQ